MESNLPEQHKAYWRKSLTITWLALFLWLVATILVGLYAREAPDLLTAVYAVLTACYAWTMSRQDRIAGC